MPNFIDLEDLDSAQIRNILDQAKKIKKLCKVDNNIPYLKDKHLAMIFEKPSTRTRISFEVGINQLGGKAIILDSSSTQMGRGESIFDTAKVMSRFVDIIMIRCFDHNTLLKFGEYAEIPVINGLTNYSHPCQVLADILTFEEHKGNISESSIAWIGDFNNMTRSWIHAALKLNFKLNIATPKQCKPKNFEKKFKNITWFEKPEDAVKNSDLVTTDTWVSMGDADSKEKVALLKDYQVNSSLMLNAKDNAIFMHCLPAHINDEVSEDVLYGKQSVIFDEAENRLHIQKSIMIWCLKK